MSTAIDKIWIDDLLLRRENADELEAYIVSSAERQLRRGKEGRAFTIAVDAQYGVGKTFFLKRLAKQMKLTHPVAYVDAWADDIADVPLVALAATLKEALEPYLSDKKVEAGWSEFIKKAGAVTAVVAKGLAWKGVEMAIGSTFSKAVSDVLAVTDEDIRKAAVELATNAGADAVDTAKAAIKAIKGAEHLEAQISDFELGIAAITGLKDGLRALVSALRGKKFNAPPIVIIIDELDRCRPTYAVKMLEEIKHLFDVPGIVFVLGMNGDQLQHSIVGAYGPNFDGASYIRRFIDRTYTLRDAQHWRILKVLMEKEGLRDDMFVLPVFDTGERDYEVAEFLEQYMILYGATARDCSAIVHTLSTFCAVARSDRFLAPYLFGLIVQKVMGKEDGGFTNLKATPNQSGGPALSFRSFRNPAVNIKGRALRVYTATLLSFIKQIPQDLHGSFRNAEVSIEANANIELEIMVRFYYQPKLGNLRNRDDPFPIPPPVYYPDFLSRVGRFGFPDEIEYANPRPPSAQPVRPVR